jgi:hypothetical protein
MPLGTRFTPGQRKATWALVRFCSEHGHATSWIERLRDCLAAIDARDPATLETALKPFNGGGMGSFIDWGPLYPEDSERTEYSEVIWYALYENWRVQMKPHWPVHRP